MNEFLPQDYKEPNPPSDYTKLVDGETVLRILDSAKMGWQGWREVVTETGEKTKKPVRVKDNQGIPVEQFETEIENVKFFWAVPVWNYNEHNIQIWVITQATIRRSIVALTKSKGWGSPLEYDISITKTGEKMETEYAIMPYPKAEVEKSVLEAYQAKKIDWELWYQSENPFESDKLNLEKVVKEVK